MIITLKVRRGIWPFVREVQRTFEGSSTVWHDIETGRRPGTHLEARLADIAWLRRRNAEKEQAQR